MVCRPSTGARVCRQSSEGGSGSSGPLSTGHRRLAGRLAAIAIVHVTDRSRKRVQAPQRCTTKRRIANASHSAAAVRSSVCLSVRLRLPAESRPLRVLLPPTRSLSSGMMASPRSLVGGSARRLLVLLCVSLLALLSLCSSPCAALLARVSSHSEQCFFEMATKGDKIVGNLRVVQGGSLDIDLRILDPSGKVVLERQRVLEESWQFYAQHSGQYTLCLSNLMSVVSGKVVNFNMYVGSALQKKDAAKSEHFNPLEKSVMKLAQGVREVSDWTRHIKTRERVHHLSKTTNRDTQIEEEG